MTPKIMPRSVWRTVRLGELCRVQNGFPFKSEFYDEKHGVPLVRVRSLKTQSCDLKYKGEFDPAFRVSDGDVLIGMDGDFQPCYWKGGAALLNQRVCRLVDFSNEADAYFICEALKGPLHKIEETTHYTTVKHISSFTIQDIVLSIPPLEEQRAISNVLRAFQKAKEARQRELTLERERKGALMEYLFTHGTRGEATRQSEIGETPESWELVRLGEMFESQLGKMLSQKARVGTDPKPYMRNANVQWGRVNLTDVLRMDFSDREKRKFRLQFGDLLVCEGGEIGRTAMWKNEIPECYFQKAIHRLRPRSDDTVPTFLLYWMEWAFRFANLYGVAGTQTTIAHLPQEKLEQMKIPKTAKEEQTEITLALAACDSEIAAIENETRVLDELFVATLEELMAGRLSAVPLIEEHQPQ